MIEGDITYGGPAVLNNGCGMEFGHGFMVFIIDTKLQNYSYKNNRGQKAPAMRPVVTRYFVFQRSANIRSFCVCLQYEEAD